MRGLVKILTVLTAVLCFTAIASAQQILRQSPGEALREMGEVTRKVFEKTVTPSPKDAVTVLRYLSLVAKEEVRGDPLVMAEITKRVGVGAGVSKILDAGIEIMAEGFEKKTGVDKYQFELWAKSAKNAVLGNIPGQVIDAVSVVHESWKETVQAVKDIPSNASVDPHLAYLRDLVNGAEMMKKEKPYLAPVLDVGVEGIGLGLAFIEGSKIIGKSIYRTGEKLFPKITGVPDKDKLTASDQIAGQQQLTPVEVKFTQTFEGLVSQAADFPGSQGGNHSGTITQGARVGEGSRPGTFTSGSFNGRTEGNPGLTPTTLVNVPFAASSVGTVSARGFQEGPLKGSMTITVPAGAQTATLSGTIAIAPDGSLSMPNYGGPVRDNATGIQVGTMTGALNQGPTR